MGAARGVTWRFETSLETLRSCKLRAALQTKLFQSKGILSKSQHTALKHFCDSLGAAPNFIVGSWQPIFACRMLKQKSRSILDVLLEITFMMFLLPQHVPDEPQPIEWHCCSHSG